MSDTQRISDALAGSLRVFHISDTHFHSKRLAEKQVCADQLIAIARAVKPAVIVHAGDVFDAPLRVEDPAAIAAVRFFCQLRAIAPVLVVKGNASHDRDSVEILWHTSGPYPIHVSTTPEIVFAGPGPEFHVTGLDLLLPPHVPDAMFCTMPYPNAAFLARTQRLNPDEMRQAVSDAIGAIVRGFGAVTIQAAPKILVFHGTVDGARYSETQVELGMDINLSPFVIGQAGFTCTLAGHLHHKQQIETSSGTIFYGGGMSILCVGDEPPKGAWVYDFDGATLVSAVHHPVQTTPMRAFSVDLIADPFVVPPEWAQEDMDLEVRVRMTDADRETVRQMDWAGLFPKARSIQVKHQTEVIGAVRCEEVRQAQSLRDKVAVWAAHAEFALPPGVLAKADLLESAELNKILETL